MKGSNRVVFVRHHDEDEPALLGQAFEEFGLDVEVHDILVDGPLPDPRSIAAGVVLGCKWSVYDRGAVGEWIDEEITWLQRARREAVPVLGVCFGAQAMAAAFGGGVEPIGSTELGWTNLTGADSSIGEGPWLEFHGDRCIPPADVEVLAANEICIQAFRSGRCLAVQFHPEVDAALLQAWLDHGGDEALRHAGIDESALLTETRRLLPRATANARHLVDGLLHAGQ